MIAQEHSPERPEWLNDDFIKICVKTDIGSSSSGDIHIHGVKLQYVVPKGENYLSIILRLVVDVEFGNVKQNGHPVDSLDKREPSNERKYILKVMHSKKDAAKEVMDDFVIFDREIDMYNNFLPKLQNILLKADLRTTFGCRCLHVDIEHGVIVMEDLSSQKYAVANRIKGADLEHTKLTLSKLARLHGASMKYIEQNTSQNLPYYYYKGFIRRIEDERLRKAMDATFGADLMKSKIDEIVTDLSSRAGYEKECEILTELGPHAFDILCDLFLYDPDNPLNALHHGDCWINNMMYKYDDAGHPIDVMLIDLQGSVINSVTNEVMNFFLSSTSDDVRQYHYHEIVDFYYDNLIETLNKLGSKRTKPTKEQLHKGLLKSTSLFLMHLGMFLPMVKAEFGIDANDRSESESISLEELQVFVGKQRRNPIYLKTLFITIDRLKEIGTFEYHAELLKKMKPN